MEPKKIRIVLAEDHHVVRAAVASFLAREPDFEIVAEVAEAEKLPSTLEATKPDVLVLDAHMPGHRVIETARAVRRAHPSVRILVLSAYKRREYVVGLIEAGAYGYVLKDDPPESLLGAVRAVFAKKRWLSPGIAEVLAKSALRGVREELTERESEVLRLMATGCRNERIAETLRISEQTVKNHIRNIFGKLGVETRVEAVLYAISEGLAGEDAMVE
jgi:NarL family two-component system response regulator LiaR